jgi:hypothetical protein
MWPRPRLSALGAAPDVGDDVDAFHLCITTMAVWEAVEIWHHSSLFAGVRARIELWDGKIGAWLRDLLECPFCLSVWVALFAVLLMEVSVRTALDGPRWAFYCSTIPIYTLAVARLSNLLNDLTHKVNRTPKSDRLDMGDDVEDGDEGASGE